MALYSDKVMDHFQNPRNVGKLEDADGIGEVGNAKCGDIMRMYIKVDDNGIITDCKFNTFGCGSAIATSSMATELIKGQVRQGGAGAFQSGRRGGAGRAAPAEDTLGQNIKEHTPNKYGSPSRRGVTPPPLLPPLN